MSCEYCARRGSVYMLGCRGCEARKAARAPKKIRQSDIYPSFKREHGEVELEKFRAEAKVEWDKDAAQHGGRECKQPS